MFFERGKNVVDVYRCEDCHTEIHNYRHPSDLGYLPYHNNCMGSIDDLIFLSNGTRRYIAGQARGYLELIRTYPVKTIGYNSENFVVDDIKYKNLEEKQKEKNMYVIRITSELNGVPTYHSRVGDRPNEDYSYVLNDENWPKIMTYSLENNAIADCKKLIEKYPQLYYGDDITVEVVEVKITTREEVINTTAVYEKGTRVIKSKSTDQLLMKTKVIYG